MATATFNKLATITLPSAQSSVTFSSLPTGYSDLAIMGQFNLTSSIEAFRIYFNNDFSGGNYNVALLGGNGSAASGGASNGSMVYYKGSGSGSLALKMDILGYRDTTKKTMSVHTIAAPDVWTGLYVNRWLSSNDAITSVTLKCDLSTLTAGSTFSLYGIAG